MSHQGKAGDGQPRGSEHLARDPSAHDSVVEENRRASEHEADCRIGGHEPERPVRIARDFIDEEKSVDAEIPADDSLEEGE
jgi:hypothetical protein